MLLTQGRLLAALFATAIACPPALAESSWNFSAGVQADESGANAADADVAWSPTDAFTFSVAAGHVDGDSDEGDFSARTTAAAASWRPFRRLGITVGYDAWDDPSTFEKRTAHAALYVGGDRARIGLLGESIETETTGELAVLRRRTSLAFNGTGYGVDARLSGKHVDFYVSYMSYDYQDNINRLLNFLADPSLIVRPRVEALINSGLTAAGALVESSATAGVDVFVKHTRIGIAFSQYDELVANSDTHTLHTDVEWPLSARWSANLLAGMSDSDTTDATLFGGARLLFHSR
jgi:hypothetical protein